MLIVTRQFQAALCCFPSPTNHKSIRFPLLLEVFEARGGVAVFLVFLSAVDWPQILRWPQIPRPPSWFHTQSWVSPNKQAVGWKYQGSVKDTYIANCPPLWISFTSNVQTASQFRNAWWTLWSTFHIKLSQVTICAPAQDVWRSSPIWIFIT